VAERKVAADAVAEELHAPWGHDEVLRGLCAAARVGRLAHALEFSGPAGVGKFVVARWFAAALVCERGPTKGGELDAPCQECGACRRSAAGTHPDLFVVDVRQEAEKERSEELRLGRFVPREEARRTYWPGDTVEDFLGLRAAHGGWRVVIVREAERVNTEAQNAILKSLEEPSENVLWILETSRPYELLPTIHSRAIAVEFAPLPAELAARIARDRGVDPSAAQELARWSGGSPGDALALDAERALELRDVLIAAASGATNSTTAAAALWASDGEFDGKSERAQQRARARRVLDIALELARDVERLRTGVASHGLPHGAAAEALLRSSAFGAPRAARKRLEVLLRLRADLDANVDPVNVVERAVIELAPRRAAQVG